MRTRENLMTLEVKPMSKSWKLRSDFLKNPVIDEWYHLNPNTVQAGKQMSKLLIICNTLKITPESLIQTTDPVNTLKKTLIEFKKICDL